jgi:transcriptional regulator with XRE-family HTH domain
MATSKIEIEIEMARKAISRNLKSLRKEKSLAQEKLALNAGVDRTVVSKIEREVTNPSIEILVRLAVALEVPVKSLFY